MEKILKNQKLRKFALTLKPWVIFIGILFVLKVTGALSGISQMATTAVMKTGVMDVDPSNTATSGEAFNDDFTIKDLEGNTLHFSELKGKVIFLNLWATWCGPCRVEMPSIQKLYNSVDQEKIAFVMLSLDAPEHEEKVNRFVRDKAFTFPVYLPASPLPKVFQVNSIPTTFIIAPDGKVRSKKVGTANYDTDEFRQFLEKLQQ